MGIMGTIPRVLVSFLLAGVACTLAACYTGESALRYVDAPLPELIGGMAMDEAGVLVRGLDGVLRSLGTDLRTVIDWRQLSPEQYDALGVKDVNKPAPDGRNVLDIDQLQDGGHVTYWSSYPPNQLPQFYPPAGADCNRFKSCWKNDDCRPFCQGCLVVIDGADKDGLIFSGGCRT
ncbi:hypothetical protein G7046_g280 [Stylonectria norvegica]|nr:hypothetical protein G7046_g280 [Stylonectria norvegica]